MATFVPASVAEAFLRRLGIGAAVALAHFSRADRRRLVRALVEWPLAVTGTRGYNYAEEESLQVLELPYNRNELSMVVLLPRAADGLAKLEQGLTTEKLDGWQKAVKPVPVRVSLPRFKTEKELSLEPVLKAMGMPSAFDRGKAVRPLRGDTTLTGGAD